MKVFLSPVIEIGGGFTRTVGWTHACVIHLRVRFCLAYRSWIPASIARSPDWTVSEVTVMRRRSVARDGLW